ncbi:hemerythrin domain-containing protein [Rhodococcus sp. NPDC003318]|uniref:hemerythrin domain-containing protein n=1 Tax=Rhodococcus sp. NPDC003318 TaxID=3364503 RepID=UPI00368E15DF
MKVVSPAAPPRPDVNEMVVIHRVFRREFTVLPKLIRAVTEGDAARAGLVAEHLTLILDGLHMHHTGEDAVLWPLLQVRAAPSTALVETMQRQHELVDGRTEEVRTLSAVWAQAPTPIGGEQLAQLVEDLATALFEHLDLEERQILPLVSRHITAPEWQSLGDHGRDAMSTRQLPLMFGAILEEADADERGRMLAQLPAPVRLFLRTVGARQYRRYITRVRAA